jgi:hypothetical protein
MANPNIVAGLIPRRLRNGAPWVGPCSLYYHPATDGNALYPGDPFIIAGSADTRGVPTGTLATAGATNRITGAVVAIVQSAPFGTQYGAASTAFYFLAVDDPDVLYEIQEDSVGGALAATNVGQNCDLIAAAGTAATASSGWMLDSSTAGTGATLQTRIVRLEDRADNVIGTNAKWLVAVNLPTETGAAGSTGV